MTEGYETLCTMLDQMGEAAARADKEELARLNTPFTKLYKEIMPQGRYERDSYPDLFERTRNAFLYVVSDIMTTEEQQEQLTVGRTLLTRLKGEQVADAFHRRRKFPSK